MEKKRQKITGTLQKSRFGRNLRCNVYFLFIALYAPSFNPMHQASFPAVTQPGTKTREALLCLYNTTTAESTVPRKGSWSMARTHGAWCERKGHGANARGMVRTHGAWCERTEQGVGVVQRIDAGRVPRRPRRTWCCGKCVEHSLAYS